ncbi:hypothetical protein BGZ80_001566 [Entomortierella chlamydospora]|uniref:Uncharacterized protein n=1 Tax=Entomortierella chlamydospora TaxID=101097 RepID=A0A9P6N2Z0_9FUNG|nr:hypothetical protein BGZ80_001566 [Entomortierella chlamydospora]
MASFESSDDWSAFNSADHAKFLCYETNCDPDDPNDSYFGPLNGPGDGICSTSFTTPPNLPDDGVYYGQPDVGFGEYYTCTNYIVQGGQDLIPMDSQGDQRIWQGGDVSKPGTDVCKYWRSNKIGARSFGNHKPPNPQPDDPLSQSLELLSESRLSLRARKVKKRWGIGIGSDAYVGSKTRTNVTL